MLTSKQRAYLRSLAVNEDTILMIGKGGIDGDVVKQAADAIFKRELIKGKVLETAPVSPREAAEVLAEQTESEVVQVIGSKFALYKRNEKDPKIVLPRAKRHKLCASAFTAARSIPSTRRMCTLCGNLLSVCRLTA